MDDIYLDDYEDMDDDEIFEFVCMQVYANRIRELWA